MKITAITFRAVKQSRTSVSIATAVVTFDDALVVHGVRIMENRYGTAARMEWPGNQNGLVVTVVPTAGDKFEREIMTEFLRTDMGEKYR